jgi:2-oxoglutarate ferredoxin oxidoreductase subunit beta
MLTKFREETAPVGSKKVQEGVLPRGVLVEVERPEYCEEYDRMLHRVQDRAGNGDKK